MNCARTISAESQVDETREKTPRSGTFKNGRDAPWDRSVARPLLGNFISMGDGLTSKTRGLCATGNVKNLVWRWIKQFRGPNVARSRSVRSKTSGEFDRCVASRKSLVQTVCIREDDFQCQCDQGS